MNTNDVRVDLWLVLTLQDLHVETECGDKVWRQSVRIECGDIVWRQSHQTECGDKVWRDRV